ncbi:MAG: YvcK family protein [Armatimonadetes bacterium]|nr:YvcK family protein [Armatimonadota bacterium]
MAQGQRIVVLGGGTGLSTLLRGLKEFTSNITAIVTVTDDGGSSGRLGKELGVLPPGDIRNCLVALADAEPLMTELFQHRFKEGAPDLAGHSFGNLLIAAMTAITGDFEEAIKETSNILAIRGRVLPSTLCHVTLQAEMSDGRMVVGETNITRCSGKQIRRILLDPAEVYPLQEALDAIHKAAIIIIGPGSVFTSVVPNLLVRGIAEAIAGANAVKIYVCNVMTQAEETARYSASDHVQAVIRHAPLRLFDYVLANTEVPSEPLLERYRQEGADYVVPDLDKIQALGFTPVGARLISQTHVVRHDPHKLAEAVINLSLRG